MRAAHFKTKYIRSDPCTCTTNLSESFIKRHSRLHSKKFNKDIEPVSTTVQSKAIKAKRCVCECNIIQKPNKSFQRLKNAKEKVKNSIRSSISKIENKFRIRKDSIMLFRDKLMKKRAMKKYECEPYYCIPEECAPPKCYKKVKMRLDDIRSDIKNSYHKLRTISSGMSFKTRTKKEKSVKKRKSKSKPVICTCEPESEPDELVEENKDENSFFSKKRKDSTSVKRNGLVFHIEPSVLKKKKSTKTIKNSIKPKKITSPDIVCKCEKDATDKIRKTSVLSKISFTKPKSSFEYGRYSLPPGDRTFPRECQASICIPGECDLKKCAEILQAQLLQPSEYSRTHFSSKGVANVIATKSKHSQSLHLDERHVKSDNIEPKRQAVRISSNFSFNIEFYKEQKNTEKQGNIQNGIRKHEGRHRKSISNKTKYSSPRKASFQNKSVQSKIKQLSGIKTNYTLKRCFCTLQLKDIPKSGKSFRRLKDKQIKPMTFSKCDCAPKLKNQCACEPKEKKTTQTIKNKKTNDLPTQALPPAPLKEAFACDPYFDVGENCDNSLCDKRVQDWLMENRKKRRNIEKKERKYSKGTTSPHPMTKTCKSQCSNFSKCSFTSTDHRYNIQNTNNQHQLVKTHQIQRNENSNIENASNRSVVRIGSSFSFNIQFYKENEGNDPNVIPLTRDDKSEYDGYESKQTPYLYKDLEKPREACKKRKCRNKSTQSQFELTNEFHLRANQSRYKLRKDQQVDFNKAVMKNPAKKATDLACECSSTQTPRSVSYVTSPLLPPTHTPVKCDDFTCKQNIRQHMNASGTHNKKTNTVDSSKSRTKSIKTLLDTGSSKRQMSYQTKTPKSLSSKDFAPHGLVHTPVKCDCKQNINQDYHAYGSKNKKISIVDSFKSRTKSYKTLSDTGSSKKQMSYQTRTPNSLSSKNIAPLSSHRQAVRIGSSFSFNVEFYKHRSSEIQTLKAAGEPVFKSEARNNNLRNKYKERLSKTIDIPSKGKLSRKSYKHEPRKISCAVSGPEKMKSEIIGTDTKPTKYKTQKTQYNFHKPSMKNKNRNQLKSVIKTPSKQLRFKSEICNPCFNDSCEDCLPRKSLLRAKEKSIVADSENLKKNSPSRAFPSFAKMPKEYLNLQSKEKTSTLIASTSSKKKKARLKIFKNLQNKHQQRLTRFKTTQTSANSRDKSASCKCNADRIKKKVEDSAKNVSHCSNLSINTKARSKLGARKSNCSYVKENNDSSKQDNQLQPKKVNHLKIKGKKQKPQRIQQVFVMKNVKKKDLKYTNKDQNEVLRNNELGISLTETKTSNAEMKKRSRIIKSIMKIKIMPKNKDFVGNNLNQIGKNNHTGKLQNSNKAQCVNENCVAVTIDTIMPYRKKRFRETRSRTCLSKECRLLIKSTANKDKGQKIELMRKKTMLHKLSQRFYRKDSVCNDVCLKRAKTNLLENKLSQRVKKTPHVKQVSNVRINESTKKISNTPRVGDAAIKKRCCVCCRRYSETDTDRLDKPHPKTHETFHVSKDTRPINNKLTQKADDDKSPKVKSFKNKIFNLAKAKIKGSTVTQEQSIRPCKCGSKICKKKPKLWSSSYDDNSPKVKSFKNKIFNLAKAKIKGSTVTQEQSIRPCECGSKICKKKPKLWSSSLTPSIESKLVCLCHHECECADTLKKANEKKQKQKLKKKPKKQKKHRKKAKKHKKKQMSVRESRASKRLKAKLIKSYNETPDSLLLAESCLDLTKMGAGFVWNVMKGSYQIITDPKRSYENLKDGIRNPDECKIKRDCARKATAVQQKLCAMRVTKNAKNKLESWTITNYLIHAFDDDPKKRLQALKPKPKKRKERIDFECSLFMGSLRKRPFLWVYDKFPQFYPQFISLLAGWRQFVDMLLFLSAVVVWSPCIFCIEFCRALVCCCLCTG
ncbi:hypothetical protein ABMA27_015177 [Loxostege sticticalis]|uniref:Uncharacterized protein n=1 Tax=Loxostege sticticalis TaxID=481309 RepID=A0ABR3I6S3_LOXSC